MADGKKLLRLGVCAALYPLGAVGATSALEEIIVTATARKVSALEVPSNLSVLNGDDIAAEGIRDQAELLRNVAGVAVLDRGYRNSGTVNNIIVRGLNVDSGTGGDNAPNAVSTVATYVDNTPIYANFVLKDLQRVEVLRGPQGTLYGSGSLGGTVRYITNQPDPGSFAGRASVDFGQSDGSDGYNANYDLMLNVPLGSKAAIRGHVGRIDNDGVIDYVNAYRLSRNREPLIDTGSGCVDPRDATDQQVIHNNACFRKVKDADYATLDYGRLALRVEPMDTLTFSLSYQTQSDDVGARRSVTLGDNGQPQGSPLRFQYGEYDSGQVLLEPSTRDVDLYALDVEWDVGFATLTSNSSYYEHEGVGERDNGGFWVSGGELDPDESRDFVDMLYTGWIRPAQRTEAGFEDTTFVQEFRIVSSATDARVDWLAGAFYMDQEMLAYSNSWNPGMNNFAQACAATNDPACAGFWPYLFFPGQTLTENDFEYKRNVDFREIALYGEVTWNVSQQLHLTAGLRWFDNETVNDGVMGFPLIEGWESPKVPRSVDEDDDFLFKLNVAYDVNDRTLAYATVSEGYRRGGANAVPSQENGDPFGEPNAAAIQTFQKDSVLNYELGVKGRTDRLTYAGSIFYLDWDDPQLNTATLVNGFLIADNGSSAFTTGVELELTGQLTSSLQFRLGYTWTQAELDEDFYSSQNPSVLVAPDGATLPGTPEHTLSVGLDNTWSLAGDLTLVGRVGGYYQSETENFLDQGRSINETHDSFLLVAASLTLGSESWDVSLYGKNLGNEEAVTSSFPQAYWSYDTGVFEGWYGNGNRQMITQPRTIGIAASYRF